jgi:hypothetical protein
MQHRFRSQLRLRLRVPEAVQRHLKPLHRTLPFRAFCATIKDVINIRQLRDSFPQRERELKIAHSIPGTTDQQGLHIRLCPFVTRATALSSSLSSNVVSRS